MRRVSGICRGGLVVTMLLGLTASLACAVGRPAAATAEIGCPRLLGCVPSPPAVGLEAVSGLSSTSATLQGQVDPGGLVTSYQFEYAPTGDPSALVTLPGSQLTAGATPQPVTALIAGLTAETSYAVALVATNAQGSRSAIGVFETPPPIKPTLGIGAVTVHPTEVDEGATIAVTAHVSGPLSFYSTFFGAPTATLDSRPRLAALSLPSIAKVTVTDSGLARFLPVTPKRNTSFRVRVGAGVSPWVNVFVKPLLELYTSRSGQRPGEVKLAYSASGDLPRGYRRGPAAYFYRGARRSGPFRRIARGVFRRAGVSFYARATVRAPAGGYYVVCTRRPIIPHMGRPFRDLTCGALRLPSIAADELPALSGVTPIGPPGRDLYSAER